MRIAASLRAAFASRPFAAVFAVMLACALGLNVAVASLDLHFRKAPVELRRPLDALPSRLGPWLKVIDERFAADVEHTLGTTSYISRAYLDTRRVDASEVARLEAMDAAGRSRRAMEIAKRDDPRAVVFLHSAYYTGMVDTVAHVPERCMVGGGFNPENPGVVELPVFDAPGRPAGLKVKYCEYRDRARPNDPKRDVAYVFQVNGSYEHDSITGVRARLQNISEKFGYYAKVEVATYLGDDAAAARSAMADLLSHAMPELEKCLPDWTQLTGEASRLNRAD